MVQSPEDVRCHVDSIRSLPMAIYFIDEVPHGRRDLPKLHRSVATDGDFARPKLSGTYMQAAYGVIIQGFDYFERQHRAVQPNRGFNH